MGIASHFIHLVALLGVVLTYVDWLHFAHPGAMGRDVTFGVFALPYLLGLFSLQFPPWEAKGTGSRLIASLGLIGGGIAALQALAGIVLVLGVVPDLPTPWLKVGGCVIAIPAALHAARTSLASLRRGPDAPQEVAPSPTGLRAKVDAVLGDDVIATLLAVGFVALFVFLLWARPNLRTQPKLLAGGAFFAFCAGVGIWAAVTSRLVQKALRGEPPGQAAVVLEVSIAFARGFSAVLGAYLVSLTVTTGEFGYHSAVGAILVLFAVFPLVLRRTRYTAGELGITERHARGTTTYRWSEIAAVDVMIFGGGTSVLVALKDPEGSLARTEFQAQLSDGAADLNWIQTRRARMAKSLASAGHHLTIPAAADPSLPEFVAITARHMSQFGL